MKNYRFRKFKDNLGNKYLYRFHEAVVINNKDEYQATDGWFDDIEDFKLHMKDPAFYFLDGDEPTEIVEDSSIEIKPEWIEGYVKHSDVVNYNLDGKHEC